VQLLDPRLRIALRLPTLIFFLLTCWFGLLSYVTFAYLQFLRHQLFGWLEFFVLFHHILYWAALLPGLLSIADELSARRPAAWMLAGTSTVYGVWLLFHPVLPTLVNDGRSLVIGLSALAIPLAFAAIDHLAARPLIDWNAFDRKSTRDTRRALQTAAAAAIYLWFVCAGIAAIRIWASADRRLQASDYAVAVLWSLSLHLAVAAPLCLMFWLPTFVSWPRLRYVLRIGLIAAVASFVIARVVCPALAFQGVVATSAAVALGASGAIVWSGLAMRTTLAAHRQPESDLDLVMMSVHRRQNSRSVTLALVVLAIAAYAAVEGIAKFDWYFLLQKLIAFAVWIAALIIAYRLPELRRQRTLAVTLAVCVTVVAGRMFAAGTEPAGRLMLAADRYAAYDPSLMLIDSALSFSSTHLADLTTFLVAHSNVVHARPASVDFVDALQPAGKSRPHIFLFVVDSLRRDYLSPYNPEVAFTPAIHAFAADSLTFTRAFTRYGGTGLSEPAIWSGTMLPHKEYVTPFAPMNALEKLVTAEQYHRLISVDSILRQLLTPSSDVRELDAGIPNRQYDSCRTFAEIQRALPDVIRDGRPAFVFTQPQDIHLANVAIDRVQRPAGAYPGFYPPYAARLERLDACFGKFIEYLKETGLYERSIVILTSDHGDSLGDEGRWGHAYTVFPEVIRVPLIVHAPRDLQRGSADPDTVAFTTDITPTLYKLLGHDPREREPMFGMPLIDTNARAIARRRSERYLVASSYGPVYGLVWENGEDLYLVDSVNTAEFRYDLRQGMTGRATMVTNSERETAARAIREQVLEISRFYGSEPAGK
jgi:hypothetical protein